MLKKAGLYLAVAGLAFLLGSVCSSQLFAEKPDDAEKKYEAILKKLDEISKTQNEMLNVVKKIQVRVY